MLTLDLFFFVEITIVPQSWSLCKFESLQEVANLCMEKLDPMQTEANVLLSNKNSSNDHPLIWMIYQLYEILLIHKIHWIMIISNLQLLGCSINWSTLRKWPEHKFWEFHLQIPYRISHKVAYFWNILASKLNRPILEVSFSTILSDS